MNHTQLNLARKLGKTLYDLKSTYRRSVPKKSSSYMNQTQSNLACKLREILYGFKLAH
jgi:hypothetical protein